MADQWHYSKNNQQHGPVIAARLKELAASGELAPTDLVWKEGMSDWKPAKSIKGLFSGQTAVSPPPPPLPSPTAAPDAGTTLWQRIYADKLIFLGCCLAVSLLFTWIVPGFFTPSMPSTSYSDILSEPGFEGFTYGDPELEREVERRLREYDRGSSSRATARVLTLIFVLLDIGLAVAVGLVAYGRFTATSLDTLYAFGPPALPFANPWGVDERAAPNKPEMLRRMAAVGVGALLVLSLFAAIGEPTVLLFSLWLAVAALFLLLFGPISRSFLYAKWLPADGESGWVQFHQSGSLSREDGTSASFHRLKNHQFIDIWQNGEIIDSWKVLSLSQKSLEVQDREGRTRRYKKSMTAAEKLMSNPLSLLETSRDELLAETWLPADGTGPWIQFSRDGAFVCGDSTAGRYTLSGEQPNEAIRVQLTDNSTRQFKVVSLSLNQLVLDEGGKAMIYQRQRSSKKAGNATQADSSGSQIAPSDDGGSSENPLAGIFNFFTKTKCPQCQQRAGVKKGSRCVDREQRVMSLAEGNQMVQKWVNVEWWQYRFVCKNCNHEWFQTKQHINKA